MRTRFAHALFQVLLVAACTVPVPSGDFRCSTHDDCAPSEECRNGRCAAPCGPACEGNAGGVSTATGGTSSTVNSAGASSASRNSSVLAASSASVAVTSSSSSSGRASSTGVSAPASASSSSLSGAASSAASRAEGSSSAPPPGSSASVAASSAMVTPSSSAPTCTLDVHCLESVGPRYLCESNACIPGTCRIKEDCTGAGALCVDFQCTACGALDQDLAHTLCSSDYSTDFQCVEGTCACVSREGTCNAPPAACKTTTTGVDNCGRPCSKTGPATCFTVHPACTGGGSPTDNPSCNTPRGQFNCDLTAHPPDCAAGQWANTIGADCLYCRNTHCSGRNGLDEAQFNCDNIPVAPTP